MKLDLYILNDHSFLGSPIHPLYIPFSILHFHKYAVPPSCKKNQEMQHYEIMLLQYNDHHTHNIIDAHFFITYIHKYGVVD